MILVGYEAALPRFKETYAMLQKQHTEILSSRVRLLSPDVALVAAVGEGTYTDQAGFTSEPVGLGATLVFVRSNGEWRVAHFHQSVAPAKPPAAKPTLAQMGLFIYPAKGQTPDQQKAAGACLEGRGYTVK